MTLMPMPVAISKKNFLPTVLLLPSFGINENDELPPRTKSEFD